MQLQERIKIHDKHFIPCIKSEMIKYRIKELAKQISEDLKDKNPLFLSVLNGAFFFAGDLLKEMDFICEISFVKLASYNGRDTTGKVITLIGLEENVKGRNIVIIEDIIDSGLTMKSLVQKLEEAGSSSIKITALLHKPDALKFPLYIDYIGFEVADKFLVGYGLDYDKLGRNLKDIYILEN